MPETTHQRLCQAADSLGLWDEAALADLALTAFLDAIDAAGGRISLPVRISLEEPLAEPKALPAAKYVIRRVRALS